MPPGVLHYLSAPNRICQCYRRRNIGRAIVRRPNLRDLAWYALSQDTRTE